METIVVGDIAYIVITKDDGSKLAFEASESNPEYAYMIKNITDSE